MTSLILDNLGMVLLLGGLGVIYISAVHYAEYNARRIQELQRENQELSWYYRSLQSENMFNSLRSEVVEKVKDDGLILHRGEPRKIVVPKQP